MCGFDHLYKKKEYSENFLLKYSLIESCDLSEILGFIVLYVIDIENSIINAEKIMKNMKKQDTNNDDNY